MSRKFTLEEVIAHQKKHGFGPVDPVRRKHENHDNDRGVGATESESAPVPSLEGEAGSENVHLETPDRRHRVRITMCRKRLLDPDNSYGAVKELLDGLVASRLITSDAADWLELEVKQEVTRGEVRTVIEIEEL